MEEAKADSASVSVASSANETNANLRIEETRVISSADETKESKESQFIRFMPECNLKAVNVRKEANPAPNNEIDEKVQQDAVTDIDKRTEAD
jgi:hypothetical protein